MATRRHVLDHLDPTDPSILTPEQRLAEVTFPTNGGRVMVRQFKVE